MAAQIPVEIKYNKAGLANVKADIDKLEKEQRQLQDQRIAKLKQAATTEDQLNNVRSKEIQQQLKDLRNIEKQEKASTNEIKQQISEQRRLNSLTEKLNRELDKQNAKRNQATDKLKSGAKTGVQAGLAAGATLGAAGISATQAAAEADRLATATDNLALRFGVAGDKITRSIQEASGYTISQLGAMEAANKAMLLGVVNSEQEFDRLTKIAVSLGKAMGQDATKSIDDLTTGLGRQSKLILDNLGIIVDTDKAYADYAATINKTAGELTEAEKKQAFVNATLAQGEEMMKALGNEGLDTAGKVERLTARFSDLQVEVGRLIDTSGGLDILNDGIDRLIGGAQSWQFTIDQVNKLAEAQSNLNKEQGSPLQVGISAGVDSVFGEGTADTIQGIFNAVTGNEELAESYTELIEAEEKERETLEETNKARQEAIDAAKAQAEIEAERAEAAEEAAEKEKKRLEDVAEIRRSTLRDIQQINEDAAEAVEETWDEYFDKEKEAWEKHGDDVVKIKADAAKDLAKIDSDLAKDLAKTSKGETKQIKEIQAKASKDQKQERKRERIDALADQRLFDFELQQLAADGQGNRIRELLERRKIEEQIEKDKSSVEKQIKDENIQDDINRVREQAEERRQELRAEAEEERELRKQELEEQLQAESEAFVQRADDLRIWREEKLAELDASKQESIAKLGEELAEIGDLTKAELKELAEQAGILGEEIGKQLAEGVNKGYADNQEIEKAIAQGGGGNGLGTNTPTAGIPGFATGGIVPGPIGAPKLVVAHGGETITPPGKSGAAVTVDLRGAQFGPGVTPEMLQAFGNNLAQQIIDDVLIPWNS